MSWGFMRSVFGRRHSDQWAYQAAAEEIRSGRKREGLMLKASAVAEGDAGKADALYAKFLAEEISDESSRATIRSVSKTAYRTAAPVAKATSSWLRSVLHVSLIGLVIAAIGAYFVVEAWQRSQAMPSGSQSPWSVLGMALLTAMLLELIVIGTAAVLMLFPSMRGDNGHKYCLIIAGILSTVCVVNLMDDFKASQDLQQRYGEVPTPVSAPTATSSSPAPPRDIAYDRTLAQLEQQFPQINPESPLFSEDLTNRVAARMQQRVQTGLRKEDALRASVNEVFSQQRVAQQPVTAPAFDLKPSMGAAPPSNIPEHCRQLFIQATNSVPEDTPIAEYARIRDRAESAMQRCMRRQ